MGVRGAHASRSLGAVRPVPGVKNPGAVPAGDCTLGAALFFLGIPCLRDPWGLEPTWRQSGVRERA